MSNLRSTFSALLLYGSLTASLTCFAADPTATSYTYEQCQGSAMPYPVTGATTQRTLPDSLTPVFINHVGRHGARFLSSAKAVNELDEYLARADKAGTITPLGRKLRDLCGEVVRATAGRWGALDSLGMAEQRGIASRLHSFTPALFHATRVNAISSYVPRCVASMDEFTHQLTRLDNNVEIYTSSGRQNSPLVRPWTTDSLYKEFMESPELKETEKTFKSALNYDSLAQRLMGKDYPFTDDKDKDKVSLAAFKVISGCSAMGMKCQLADYMSVGEANALWSISNLSHYLSHSASTLSPAPMELATALLSELISTLESAAEGSNQYSVMLRFGHAETLMPLLALMRLQGCYYMTNYFDTVGLHWRDFYVVPMESNLQMFLLKATSGNLYLRVDLNETPVPLIPGRSEIYTPLPRALDVLTRCLPLT